MGLRDTFQKLAKQVIDLAGSPESGGVLKAITYTRVVVGAYDAETDTQAESETSYSLNAFVYNLTDTELDWFPGELNMQKMIASSIDLPVVPNSPDTVTIDGVVWEVHRTKRLPGDPAYIVFLRRA